MCIHLTLYVLQETPDSNFKLNSNNINIMFQAAVIVTSSLWCPCIFFTTKLNNVETLNPLVDRYVSTFTRTAALHQIYQRRVFRTALCSRIFSDPIVADRILRSRVNGNHVNGNKFNVTGSGGVVCVTLREHTIPRADRMKHRMQRNVTNRPRQAKRVNDKLIDSN